MVSAACSVLLCLSCSVSKAQQQPAVGLDPNQAYTTGNAVTYQGWVNGVYQNSLTCWAWGDPGYCGPNPIVRPGGSINFSFGTTDLYQLKSIADILPDSGNGLRVNGYNFGFTAKNGNGWDGGRQDYLIAYVKMNDPKGNESFSRIYDLNWTFNWTTFNYSETFATPYASKDLSTVQYGFVGRDNNGWAGPYGPEVYNINFSLKYSVDPCFNNPTFSATCPGYYDALLKLLPVTPTPVVETVSSPVDPVTTPTTTYTLAAPITAAPTTNTTSTETAAATTSIATATAAVSAAPTALNPQPKIGEVSTAGSTKPTVSMSTIMSAINAEQSRVQQAERMVTEQVKEISASVTANAEATATSASNQSIAAANASAAQSMAPTAAVVNSIAGVPGAQVNSGTSLNPLQAFGVPEQQPVSGEVMSVASFRPVAPTHTESYSATPENKVSEDIALKDLVLGTPTITQTQEQQPGPVVNTKAKDNDAAGSVTIASIAIVPPGYEAYSIFSLKDVPFYPPTQVYREQKTVDNLRTLRIINAKSDQLHKQMVDQQYNRGN